MKPSLQQSLIELANYCEQRKVNPRPINPQPPRYDEKTLRDALGQLEALKRLIFTMLSNVQQTPQVRHDHRVPNSYNNP